MPTLNQLTSRISNVLNQPFNLELQERIKDGFRALRATRLRQSIEKSGIDDNIKQSYIAETTKVDVTLDDCARKLGCSILRSKNKIPKPVRYKTDEPFTYVGTTDGVVFVYSDIGTIKKMKYLPVIGKATFFIYENDYIYIYGNNKLKEFRIQTVFDNIEQLINYCDDTSCYNDDMEYPLPSDMIESILQELLAKEFGITKTEDKEIKVNSNE
jgi:hypothetical protein